MGEDDPQSFGELLKEYRRARKLTQEGLAERAGVSPRSIQALERGESRPHKDTARLLAGGLGLSEQDLARFLAAATPAPRQHSARTQATGTSAQHASTSSPTTLPTGMLTFMIADVRGYTAYTHQHGDEAGARLATRFATLAEAAAIGHQGQVVEVRGDEVMAVFTSARAALRAAGALLASCAAEATAELPLLAGVGLDAGEPVPVLAGYRGEALNVAARLCARAGPGEVLASETVVGLARHVEGLTYVDRGEIALKGLSRPLHTWLVQSGATPQTEVTSSESVFDRPVLPAPARPVPSHRLPAALSPLIGREQEQRRVCVLLGEARLVTLTGSGGVGKTRLAQAVAAQVAGDYADGVWLIEFASLTVPELVPGEVARMLGLREDALHSPLEVLAGFLRSKQALLVLDNCEHLIAACAALVVALLQACPALRILATSQEPLQVDGERRYRVPSLAVPDPRRTPAYDLLSRYAAVQLFVSRAQERRDDFMLTPTNAPAVAAICAQLDGIPLALELAAARVASLPVETIAARLDNRFALLTTGTRSALPRQQTLRATLDWSYDLLSLPEQTLLQRLATFPGGADLEAVEAICADPAASAAAAGAALIAGEDLLNLLDALVQRSLLQEEQGRYRLLETIRAYAHERLIAGGEEAAVRWHHALYYLRVAESIQPELTGPNQVQWLARLEREHDNLRAALHWILTHGTEDGPLALRLAAALWRFWYLRGHLREGRTWLEGALARAGSDQQERLSTAQATTCHGAGVLAWTQGEHAQARALAERALTLWRALGDRAGSAATLNLLGLVAIDLEAWDQAAPAMEESLALRQELQDQWGIATSLHNLGTIAWRQGDIARATALYEESLRLRVALADDAGSAISYRDQAELALALDDEPRAIALYKQSLRHAAGLGDLVGVAICLDGLATIAARRARPEPAAHLLGAAAALREQVGAPIAPRDRATHEQLAKALRNALGSAFEQVQQAGRGLAWEDVVAATFDLG